MATYVHPSISSTITDNSSTYVTASGTTKLFAVFTSYKGKDNAIQLITSVSEYEFNYGEPNIKKYGQVGYNVINWLNSGGVVYCLRVLPENAGYANAIVNIQTKEGTKSILKTDGTKVSVPDVTIRPTIIATSVNNTTASAIEFDELRNPTEKTIDGYDNNMIFAVIPKGRGEGYNDLGFRISLVSSYDNTYDFRLYNFEVTRVSESGATSTIQGPFLVSLDPDALSLSGESLFIKSVIDKYCDYFTIIFNEDNYEELGAKINPHVNPNKIDFFSGVTRVLDNETETYYEELTESNEDVHMYLTKYTMDGYATTTRNIVDADDTVESEIVGYDNSYRTSKYEDDKATFENLKVALSKIKKVTLSANPYETLLRPLITELNDKDIEADSAALTSAKNDMVTTTTVENYKVLSSAVASAEKNITEIISKIKVMNDYVKVDGSNVDSIKLTEQIKAIKSDINNNASSSIKFISMQSKITDLKEDVNDFDNLVDSDKEELIAEIINDSDSMIKTLNSRAVEEFTSTTLSDVDTKYHALVTNYLELTAQYISDEDYTEAKENCKKACVALFTALTTAIDYVSTECKTKTFEDVYTKLVSAKTTVLSMADNAINHSTSNDITESSVIDIIDSFQTKLDDSRQDTYNVVLQNFDSNIRLRYGSDGDIANKTYSSKEVEKLIVNGYLGNVDTGLLDKNLYPIDVVLDANYSVNIKNAIATLTTEIRNDFVAMLDTKCQATPEQTIQFRKNSLSVNNFRLSIWSQDFVVNDSQYTGLNMQVTAPYFLASKIPSNDNAYGIHWNFVGPRRGTLSGFESVSYIPNPEWKEQMYSNQINYVEQDLVSTRFGSQLTSQSVVSALSNVNNVRALLRIQRDVEALMANYQFEYNDSTTQASAQMALNSYLNQWVSNRACDSISGTVYASDYDRLSKILRVKIEMVFNSIIERIAIDLIVNN